MRGSRREANANGAAGLGELQWHAAKINILQPRRPAPSSLCTAPTAREAGVVKPLSTACSPPPGCFSARDFALAGGPVRYCNQMGKSVGRWCATSTVSAAAASTAATTMRSSAGLTFF
jgi:hypothetical protein